jgi:glutamate N-acetyltransferase / amino-acid N-acetyltransferase
VTTTDAGVRTTPPLDRLVPLADDLPAVELAARLPRGFRAGATRAGIKASGALDLGVLATTGAPLSAAATFTTNRVQAAPVRVSRANLEASQGRVAAVVSTSGCANAATGAAGDRDQRDLAEALAGALHVTPEQTLALSTGLIGSRLPVDRIVNALGELVRDGLATTDAALVMLAEQLRTTDSRAKAATVRVELPGADGRTTVTVSGVAKGVGMIHPRMATMLALVLTDAAAEPATLRSVLAPVVERTWNQLTVDGDTSTNDTVFLLASGAAGGPAIEPGSEAFASFAAAVEAVARSLARQQAADGEGATTLLTCQVTGASDDAQARAVAREVVGSSLVKAAIHGHDPNWGRIAAAAGNASLNGLAVPVDVDRLAIGIAGVPVFDGAPLPFDPAALSRAMAVPEVLLRLDLGLGDGRGEAFGCDLTEQYVLENSAYST